MELSNKYTFTTFFPATFAGPARDMAVKLFAKLLPVAVAAQPHIAPSARKIAAIAFSGIALYTTVLHTHRYVHAAPGGR